jgi:NhaP-type Na+/H+ or K+/H+ antiporter
VALLKELGASPMLTVQIQGESLLNDGTAIVLYLISYDMLSGAMSSDISDSSIWLDIVTFLMEKALMAFALGIFIGYFFFGWIRGVSNKLEHSSSMIQITLTLCCAYWSFIFVEGVLKLSGVLATVASSLVLAHHMWPYIVSAESMHHVWHTFEALGNIIVFFLGGSITGYIVVDIAIVDWLHLIVIYIVLMVIRACLMFGSRPILRYLHADNMPVTWQDATLMTWGGLRGAVGLALAIQVNNGRAPNADGVPQIDQEDAQRLLFFVSGVAFLTTMVNATTAPSLVQKLGITALPGARQKLLRMFHQQLVNWSEDSANPQEVTDSLRNMLEEAAHEIDHVKTSKTGPKSVRASIVEAQHTQHTRESHKSRTQSSVMKSETTMGTVKSLNIRGVTSLFQETDLEAHQDNDELIEELRTVQKRCERITKNDIEILGGVSGTLPENLLGNVEDMIELIKNEFVDVGMAKVVNQVFLTLVYNNYWKLIDQSKLRPGSQESEVLLTSIRMSLSPYRADLVDFNFIHDEFLNNDAESEDVVGSEFGALSEPLPEGADRNGCIAHFVSHWRFNIFIAAMILLNAVVVGLQEILTDECDDDTHIIWLVLDGIFTSIFFIEFALKFAWLLLAYFKDPWNRFDFTLVIVGIFGLTMSILTQGDTDFGDVPRIMKLARVLRMMRFLRVFRLLNAKLRADKFVSLDLARYMTKITTMSCFITAHLMAQNDVVKYFGGNGKLDESDESEIARCILQSQVFVYKALIAATRIQKKIGRGILHELKILYQRKHITEGLRHFVEEAHAEGAISSSEAHAILHPLHHQIAACMKTLGDRQDGVVSVSNARETLRGNSAVEEALFGIRRQATPEPVSPTVELKETETVELKEAETVELNGDAKHTNGTGSKSEIIVQNAETERQQSNGSSDL